MSGDCAVCHTGGGRNNAGHGKTLTLAIASDFSTSSGTATFNGTTCSNVSCHGGQLSPAWGTPLDVSTNCTSCHKAGSAEYISNNSGRHAVHSGIEGITCVNCHDMTNSATHFKNVTTKVFETPPSSTLRSYLQYDAQKSCTVTNPTPFTGCHSDKKSWPVPVN
jgi:predicted CxxxxCH...CXXCH cytochrome family protein